LQSLRRRLQRGRAGKKQLAISAQAAPEELPTARSNATGSTFQTSSRAVSSEFPTQEVSLKSKLSQVSDRLVDIEAEFQKEVLASPKYARSASNTIDSLGSESLSAWSKPRAKNPLGASLGARSATGLHGRPAHLAPLPRRRQPVIADDLMESAWAGTVLGEMPSVRRAFEHHTLRISKSAPSLDPRPRTPMQPCMDPALGDRPFSAEVSYSKELLVDYFPEQDFVSPFHLCRTTTPQVQPSDPRAASKRGQSKNTLGRPLTADLCSTVDSRVSSRTNTKQRTAMPAQFINFDLEDDNVEEADTTPVYLGPLCLATLATRWCLPLETLKASSELFRKHALLPPGRPNSGDILRDGELRSEQLKKIVCILADVDDLEELDPEEAEAAMKTADKNGDGNLDYEEFATWYQQRAFSDMVNLTKTEKECRAIAVQYGLPTCDAESVKRLFDKFDTDVSGYLCLDEFREFVNGLLGRRFDSRKYEPVPESRILLYYQECDLNGSGHVEFDEFVKFYVTHFDSNDSDPGGSLYKNIRKGCRVNEGHAF